ncbi:hypothetical protein GOV14_05465 [Candidatus Pacearchaeota archaeon]|nr:hypothetical protein [Candidatus Pacearchaeota archaeon]
MKKKLLFIFVIGLFLTIQLSSFIFAAEVSQCNPEVLLINQDPYPAIPGEYVDLVFQVSGLDNAVCSGAKFELVQAYPFTVDDGSELRSLEGDTYTQGYKSEWMVGYTVRVDKNAVEGDNEIEVKYGENVAAISEKFEINIEDTRSGFDAVVQEVSAQEITIAVANIGKNTANSVIARIPDQESFISIGTNGQMVGNLESGDYTLVSFNIVPKGDSKTASSRSPLKLQIDYTDSINERRSIILDLPLKSGSGASADSRFPSNMQGRQDFMKQKDSPWKKWTTWVLILIVVIIVFVYRKKIKQLYLTHIKKRIPGKNGSKPVPDWMHKEYSKKKR